MTGAAVTTVVFPTVEDGAVAPVADSAAVDSMVAAKWVDTVDTAKCDGIS